jgi:hypothetical protein
VSVVVAGYPLDDDATGFVPFSDSAIRQNDS